MIVLNQNAVLGNVPERRRQASPRQKRGRRHTRPQGPLQLHVFTFTCANERGHRPMLTVLVTGRMNQTAAIALAGQRALARGRESWLTDIRSVPAPRPMPARDRMCRQHTSFDCFLDLLTAPAGYRPSIRIDLTGREGHRLARAYDRTQTAWGDPRRAFASGNVTHAQHREPVDACRQ